MDDALERLIELIEGYKADLCGLVHLPETPIEPAGHTVYWNGGKAHIGFSDIRENTVLIGMESPILPAHWYISIPAALAAIGGKKIELKTWGWWLIDEPVHDAVWITDHVACYVPNPLTGTNDAKSGKAFLGMKDSYDESHSMKSGIIGNEGEFIDGIVWHTRQVDSLDEEEMRAAREAGCSVASPNVVPWAIGARAAQCLFAALIANPEVPAKSLTAGQ
ncbi:MAG TPA: hypothetical protein ENN67_05710 [Firmicutes bacterium]|nr:hypothetical protein [Bacillota bacterium]